MQIETGLSKIIVELLVVFCSHLGRRRGAQGQAGVHVYLSVSEVEGL